jgi:tRNA pseudouridine38-40 synthase
LSHARSPTNHDRFGGGWPFERGVDALVRALNSRLPSDVLVRNAEVAAPDFDPISGATSKAYSYAIHNSRQRSLWDRRTSLHIWHELDAARMHEAAQVFVGEHDFAAFAAAGHGRLTTVRTVFSCAVRAEPVPATLPGEVGGQRITIDISGSGFLWNMVRIIAGTLVEIGRGRLSDDDVRAALTTGDRTRAGPTLPAHGLCLEWIRYLGDPMP